MGCCGCKTESIPQLSPKPKPLDAYLQRMETELTQTTEPVPDRFFEDIESMAVGLIERADWKVLLSKPNYELKYCEVRCT